MINIKKSYGHSNNKDNIYYPYKSDNKYTHHDENKSINKNGCGDGKETTKIPSYGNFWQTDFLRVPFANPFSFNNTGPTAGGVALLNPNTVKIMKSGDYRVSYIVSINTVGNPVFPHIPVVSVFLNDSIIPIANAQATFAIQLNNSTELGCFQLVGEAIISVPANSTLQLKNHSIFNRQDILTCNNGINALEITIEKVS